MADYISYIIQGAFTGFGSALGTYFALKYAIKHIEGFTMKSLVDKIKKEIE